jgi:hypothetical protein
MSASGRRYGARARVHVLIRAPHAHGLSLLKSTRDANAGAWRVNILPMRTHPNSNVPCGATESDEDREVACAQCARCMLVLWERGGEERRGERNGESGEESRTKKCWRVREGQDPSEGWHIDSAATHLSGPGSDPLSLEAILGLTRERSLVSVVSARWGEARVKRGEGLARRS